MLKFKSLIITISLLFSALSFAEMEALEDEVLSGVSGQSGITLDFEADVSIAEIAYFDDGKGISLQGLRLNAEASPAGTADFRFELDILGDGTLVFDIAPKNKARLEIVDIRFIDSPGISPLPADPSVGGIYLDFLLAGSIAFQNRGNGAIGAQGTLGGIWDIDISLTDGRLGYRTNGNEFFLDGLNLNLSSLGTVIGYIPATGELNVELPNLLADLYVDAIRYSNNPLNHGVSNDETTGFALPSYGSLWANIDADLALQILASGASGTTGLTLNSQAALNRLDLAWGDDTDGAAIGYWLGILDTTGFIDITNLTVDILDDPDAISNPAKDYGVGLALAFERLEANLHVEDLVLGETKSNIDAYVLNGSTPIKSIGSVDINVLLADGTYDLTPLTNVIYVQAGGNTDTGNQGLRLDAQLNIISPNNESNFVYTDDGNSLMHSRLEAFVDGDLTIDITSAGNINGTDFYDGLRVGIEDLAFGYRVEGYRVADTGGDVNVLKARELQAAQSIPGLSGGLVGLLGYPALEGTLDGHITLAPGGNDGQEGITINADLVVTNGALANFIQGDGSQNGVWLSGLNYDIHLRDMMLDVTVDGLKIYESESWSRMDVTDFRIGDKDTGASFGRIILETYEVGSESTLSAGGAGALCIGGAGIDEPSCNLDGGRWDDRGSQGITIATKRHFKEKIEALGKRNRFTWENNRTGEGTAAPVNGSGLQLVFDNFRTSDGDGLTDTYGFRADHNIDVSRTQVLKKSDGPDSNGVVGNKGDEKIMNPDGSYQYIAPGLLTAQNIASRPVGLAARTRTQFQELDFEKVSLVHPVGGESTLLYGLKLQNFDFTTDITATPLD